mgnify:CR=1 FL=1
MARRVPIVTREDVAEEHRAAYDEIASIRGIAPVVGPSSVMVHSPEMAVRANRLADFLTGEGELPERDRRLAALIAARSMDYQYVWDAQAAVSRQAGLSDALVDAIRDKTQLPEMSAEESALVRYGMELTGANQVSEETFAAARDQLGVKGLVEFTTNMGYYRMISLNANACTIELPDDMTEPLLPI